MAEHFRFFNSTEGDVREYLASEFAEYFNRFLSDGLYTENGQVGLKVMPVNDLSAEVAAGYAFIRGYMYHNDAPLELTLDPPDNVLHRKDRIVLRFDEVAREIRLRVKTGTFSSAPTAPALEETSTVKELGLAQVLVQAGASRISASSITDERMTKAGLVSSLIDIPAQEMWNVWNQALSNIEAEWEQQSDDIDGAWQTWFDNVQATLGARVLIGEIEPPMIQEGDLWIKIE